jgi:endosialidase-like protein
MSLWSFLGLAKSEEEKAQDAANQAKRERAGYASAFTNPESAGMKSQYGALAGAAGGRAAPTMEAAKLGPAALGTATTGSAMYAGETPEMRAAQSKLVGQLQTQAMGGGPSLATQSLKMGQEQALQGRMAAAASMKGGGGNPALAMRNAGYQQMQEQGAVNQQAALARMQEQLNAQGMLGNVAGAARAQDIGLAQFNAGQGNQFGLANMNAMNQFGLANMGAENQFALQQGQFNQQAGMGNLQSRLQQGQMNDAERARYMGMLQNQSEADRAAAMANAGFQATGALDWQKNTQGAHAADANETNSYLASAAMIAAMAASDENQKTGITSGSTPVEAFFKGLKWSEERDARKAAAASAGKGSAFGGERVSGDMDPKSKDFNLDAWQAKNLPASEIESIKKDRALGRPVAYTGEVPDRWKEYSAKGPPITETFDPAKYMGNNGIASTPADAVGPMPYAPMHVSPGPAPAPGTPMYAPVGAKVMPTAVTSPGFGPQTAITSPGFASGPPVVELAPQVFGPSKSPENAYLDSLLAKTQLPGPTMTAMSDENQKAGVTKASAAHLFEGLKPYEYHYKDPTIPFAGPGQHAGVMAQDLEAAGPIGKSMVKDTPNGKVVDFAQTKGVEFAALADVYDRLDALEGRAKKKARA